jgi:hypothetical protein
MRPLQKVMSQKRSVTHPRDALNRANVERAWDWLGHKAPGKLLQPKLF